MGPRKLFITLLLISGFAYGESESSATPQDAWLRLERMVHSGAITLEGAKAEKIRANLPQHGHRGEAQRGLASVDPALTPSRTKRVKMPDLELWLE